MLKVSAASPHLLQHRGRAVVFGSIEADSTASDDPDLDVDADCVLVVRGSGPVGYPGFPEAGNPPMPRKLLESGVTDMVRISDARMSGTGYGTCVLHVAPEAALGGPLALVCTGDEIKLDVPARRLDLLVDDEVMAQRRAEWVPPPRPAERGRIRLYTDHVLQADRGADLDFLAGGSGDGVGRHSH